MEMGWENSPFLYLNFISYSYLCASAVYVEQLMASYVIIM